MIPRDPLLPHIGLALDAAWMQAWFETALPGARLRCEIDRVKYRPRRNLSVSYRLQGQCADGAPLQQRVATRWCHGGEAARRHARALATARRPSTAGPAITHDARFDLLAHWWPNDAKLAASLSLADADRWWPELARTIEGARVPARGQALDLVQWVPEARLTARGMLAGPGSTGHAVYAKADVDGGGERTHAVMLALWHSPARRAGDLHVARPLLWQPASGLHWQAALPGQTLLQRAAQVDAPLATRVGTLLAALHATDVPPAREHTLQALRQQPIDVVTALAQVDATLAEQARPLALRLAHGSSGLALSPLVALHGDLHPGNLLLDVDGRLGLIDLDQVQRGPAVLDLGSWLADALTRAVMAGQDAAQALPACRAFAEAYARAAGWRPPESLLAWATAHQLLCQRVWRALVTLKPGRFERIGPLLGLARRLMDGGHLDAVGDHEHLQPT